MKLTEKQKCRLIHAFIYAELFVKDCITYQKKIALELIEKTSPLVKDKSEYFNVLVSVIKSGGADVDPSSHKIISAAITELLLDASGKQRPDLNRARILYDILRHIPDGNEAMLKEKIDIYHRYCKSPLEDVLYYPDIQNKEVVSISQRRAEKWLKEFENI